MTSEKYFEGMAIPLTKSEYKILGERGEILKLVTLDYGGIVHHYLSIKIVLKTNQEGKEND